ncbi:MAG: hypothetical protein IJR85_04845 [Synergistaceae bacterium]|nr:hypothetical protein [Synergistaceae bacterium]
MGNYTRWYRVGAAALTQNSKTVLGTDTYWLTAGLNPGDLFTTDGAQFYEIDSITDNSTLVLKTAYAGSTNAESSYSIIRNFTATMPADIAARTAELLGDFRKYIDTDMRSIHGKSAYELAVDQGYTGTLTQWLEELKAAQEWTSLRSEVQAMDAKYAAIVEPFTSATSKDYAHGFNRNLMYRGKCLGDKITAAQLDAIYNGTFEDMYLGDYWKGVGEWSNLTWMIVHFNYEAELWEAFSTAYSGYYYIVRNDSSVPQRTRDAYTYWPQWGGTYSWRTPNHITVMQMRIPQASTGWAYASGWASGEDVRIHRWFEYTADRTQSFSDRLLEKAIDPTFGYSHVMPCEGKVYRYDANGYAGTYGANYAMCYPPEYEQLYGYVPESTDGKIHAGDWAASKYHYSRQFAAFRARPFSWWGEDAAHSKFWLADMVGPAGDGTPTALLGYKGNNNNTPSFTRKKITETMSGAGWRAWCNIAGNSALTD